jgi:hypothetical protein
MPPGATTRTPNSVEATHNTSTQTVGSDVNARIEQSYRAHLPAAFTAK